MSTFDSVLGLHPASLAIQQRRMELLAANIANADTPHYQARDIDFAKVLGAAQQQASTLSTPAGGDAAPAVSLSASELPVGFRVPMQPSVDGNTVDEQVEQAAYADAALHYQASLNFVSGQIKSLMTAITGQ